MNEHRSTAISLPAFLLMLCIASGSALALAPEDPAPSFDLPWLQGKGPSSASAIFAAGDATVLILWNRGCPRCAGIALAMPAFADSVALLGGQVVGILFGPDDPEALKDLLWDREVAVPHLWDAGASIATTYDLGIRHLGVFVIDRAGVIRAVFDDQIPELTGPVLPAVRGVLARPATAGGFGSPPIGNPRTAGAADAASSAAYASVPSSGLPDLAMDGRLRVLSTEGAHPGDTGLNGETLQNGLAFLFRWDLRMTWRLSANFDLAPRLIASNESDEVLTEAEEQRTSRYGTASLHARAGRLSGTLGAYNLRLSPLLLQRWDSEDAPPLGGASGCGCGGGGGELQQYSLEVLGPDYLFEGVSGSWTRKFAHVRAFAAVPHWEHAVPTGSQVDEIRSARYRRTLGGASVDLGAPGLLDPRTDLPRPFGLRGGYLSIGDDQRTIPAHGYVRPPSWDERGWFLLGQAGPWRGITADAEYVDWRVDRTSRTQPARDAAAYRAGLRLEESVGRTVLWGSLHRLHCEPDFEPLYTALTYEANREGWRGWVGLRRLESEGGSRERWAIALFYRGVEEIDAITWSAGSVRERVASISLSARPRKDLLAELHGILNETDRPADAPDLTTRGLSLDLAWDALASVEPILRIDALRRDDGTSDPHTIWEGWLSVRVLK